MTRSPIAATTMLMISAATALATGGFAHAGDVFTLVIDRFNPAGHAEGTPAPAGWKPLHFRKIESHTEYRVEKDGVNMYLCARADASASAVYKELDIDIREFPVLTWRWRIAHTIERGNALTKEGDDYAARLYVTFDYDPERLTYLERLKYALLRTFYGETPPGEALTYIWANRLEKGRSIANPYSEKAAMFAVESGDELAGRWVEEERNVYEDYKDFFGREPRRATRIAIMTDTDNTGESTSACYDDIILKKSPPD